MSAGMLGNIFGGFLGCIMLPVLLLIVAKFVPAMKRNPNVVYGICVVLVLFVGYLSYSGGGLVLPSAISVALALAFLFWGYKRDTKALAASTPK